VLWGEKLPTTPPHPGRGKSFYIIRNTKNLGFGGSHNVGMRQATGDFILCLNADCELDKDYVKYALETFDENPRIGSVQGKLINPKTNKLDTSGLLIFKNRRVINRGQGDEDKGQFNKPEEIWGVDGAAPVYRRAALEDTKIPISFSVGPREVSEGLRFEYFDEDFFAYKEDIDLAWRMRSAGWRAMYQPKSVAYHDRSAGEGTAKNPFEMIKARKGISEFAKFHSFANQRLMQIKNETPRLFFKYLPLILAKEILSWTYILFFERYGVKSAVNFFKLLPRAVKKRKYVMAKKRVGDREIESWFV
jgi:GT2 family glycosyltransferase